MYYSFDDIIDVHDDRLLEQDDDDESMLINIQVYIHIDDFVEYLVHRQRFPLVKIEESHLIL
jgi:hypothetical protein